jgi:large subunit ribosomal protein L9
MQVILTEKVRNLGDIGERVEVKGGYGRNYLIPQGKAVFASPANVRRFEERRAELERAAAENLAAATTRAAALEGMTVTIAQSAGEGGRLFGAVTTRQIADALTARGQAVERKELNLPEGPIRQVGTYAAEVHLHADVVVTVQVEVVSE